MYCDAKLSISGMFVNYWTCNRYILKGKICGHARRTKKQTRGFNHRNRIERNGNRNRHGDEKEGREKRRLSFIEGDGKMDG